jgi:hypothetical protein
MWLWLYCVHRVVFQTTGVTPLHIASMNGHVECVRTLLDRGAAIDQAKVSCPTWTAEYCGSCVGAGMSGTHRVCMCSLWGALGWNAVECVDEQWWCLCGTCGAGGAP